MVAAQGPLVGVRVVEFAGIGPAPFCGMLLSDMGAEVLMIERPGIPARDAAAVLYRGRQRVTLDLKAPEDRQKCLSVLDHADIALEGFRPGVMERLGLGPDDVLPRNPRLVYGRMTGWGQTGPYAAMAGHDINYIALSGALHAIGSAERPVPPLNLIGDFGGGALYLAFGVLAALLHARASGRGQVIDCAISDGTASLMSMLYGYYASGNWIDRRAANRLDGGAPFYGTFQCADGQWIALGSLEPQFYAELLERLGIAHESLPDRSVPENWPVLRKRIAECIAGASQDEWCARLEGTDVCFAPVLSLKDAPHHSHNLARGTFSMLDGVLQPAPTPRFSETPGSIQQGHTVEHLDSVAARWSRAQCKQHA